MRLCGAGCLQVFLHADALIRDGGNHTHPSQPEPVHRSRPDEPVRRAAYSLCRGPSFVRGSRVTSPYAGCSAGIVLRGGTGFRAACLCGGHACFDRPADPYRKNDSVLHLYAFFAQHLYRPLPQCATPPVLRSFVDGPPALLPLCGRDAPGRRAARRIDTEQPGHLGDAGQPGRECLDAGGGVSARRRFITSCWMRSSSGVWTPT